MTSLTGNHRYSDSVTTSRMPILPATSRSVKPESELERRTATSNVSSGIMKDDITPTGTTAHERPHAIKSGSRSHSVRLLR